MSEFKLEGVFPALVTPFKKDETIDEEAFTALIQHVMPHVDGIVPCGTTGEFVYLDLKERKRLIDLAIDEMKNGKYVIAGTGACATKHAIELSKYAKDAGANASLVVSPYYLNPTDNGHYEHFFQIAAKTDFPIIMYNIPQCTGSYLPRRVIEDLAQIDNIVGLKDSSGNLTFTLEVLEKVGDKIDVVIGHDEVVLPALSAGCKGMILASAQVFPDIWQELFKAVKDGNLKEAQKVQMKVQKLARIFCRYGGAVPVKAALRMMGLKMGRTRKPLREGGVIIHEDREEIRVELEKLVKIQPAQFEFTVPDVPITSRFEDIGMSEEDIQHAELLYGTAQAGEDSEQVHVDLVCGKKNGLLGKAFALQLTHPRHGHEALTTILEPNLTVRPSTLIVPAIKLKNLRQANMIFGPTQSAVAKVIVDNIQKGTITKEMTRTHVMILKIFVPPNALNRQKLYENNYQAVDSALNAALKGIRGGD
ncbi:MAG: 4-hydroxy-tetrahydrodipicolinate synthase [Methanomassiliicoccales archaeon]|nr:MAG: 4-hydroxy-tetrahydrodipicolinate synthase [Methanomassiliicoccales archaeon]